MRVKFVEEGGLDDEGALDEEELGRYYDDLEDEFEREVEGED